MKEAFEIVTVKQEGPQEWYVDGRAYVDVNIGDTLVTSADTTTGISVKGIVSYGKDTHLLSTMMTGTLLLEGNIRSDLKFLYVPDQ